MSEASRGYNGDGGPRPRGTSPPRQEQIQQEPQTQSFPPKPTLAEQVEHLVQSDQTIQVRAGLAHADNINDRVVEQVKTVKDASGDEVDNSRENLESCIETTRKELVSEAGNVNETLVRRVETATSTIPVKVEAKKTVVERVQTTMKTSPAPYKLGSNDDKPPPIPTSLLPEDDEIDDPEQRSEDVVIKTVTTSVKIAEVEDLDDDDNDDDSKQGGDVVNNNLDDDVHNTTGGSDFNENMVKNPEDDTNASTSIDNANITPKKSTETTI